MRESDTSQVIIAHPTEGIGKQQKFSLISRDITARLEANRQLEELAHSREQMIAVLAHDLRGPIGNSLQLIRMYREDLDGHSKEDIEDGLLRIENSLNGNVVMMESLLAWTRAQLNELEVKLEVLPLYDVVSAMVEALHCGFDRKGIRCEVGIDRGIKVEADQQVLQTIIRNLICNAIKFSPNRTLVSVTAVVESEWVRLLVVDQGGGMSEEKRQRINQGNPVSSDLGTEGESGCGLGLSLCQRLVGAMTKVSPVWRLDVAATSGQGTTMEMVIPIAR
jgi:signal transduction histidine kinase